MKNTYTFVELQGYEKKIACAFCYENNEAMFSLRTRSKETNILLGADNICLPCREKFEKKQLRTCQECERVFRKGDGSKCMCRHLKTKYGEKEIEEKEPERYSTQLETQLHELSLEHKQLKSSHVEAIEGTMEASKNWYERKWDEEIVPLQEKSRRLSDENKTLKSQVEELRTQLLGVDETAKKARRLSNENRTLKGKVEGLELEVEKYKGENSELKSGISQIKSDVLETEAKIEKLLSGTELQAQVEQPPK